MTPEDEERHRQEWIKAGKEAMNKAEELHRSINKPRIIVGILLFLLLIGTVQATYLSAYEPFKVQHLHFNGSNGGTIFTDETGKTVTRSLAFTCTTVMKLGNASGVFNNAYYLMYGDSADWDRAVNGSFTWQAWVNTSSPASTMTVAIINITVADVRFRVQRQAGAWQVITGAESMTTPAVTMNANEWYHIAVINDGVNTRFFQNGIQYGTNRTSTTAWATATGFLVGNDYAAIPSNPWYGHIDEMAFWKGVAIPNGTLYPQSVQIGWTIDPVSSFTSNISTSQIIPQTVQFNDTSSFTPDMLNWSVNATSPPTWYNITDFPASDARNISYPFTARGVYQVNLTVSNLTISPGVSSTSSKTIWMNQTLYANFNASPVGWSHVNRSINFVDMSTGGGLYNWSWDFGDINSTAAGWPPGYNRSHTRNPVHQFILPGAYNINLTVKGADGQNTTFMYGYRANLNNTFTVIVRDADTFDLITTPVTIKLSQLGVDYSQSQTSGGVATFELPDGTYDVMAAAIPGEYESNIASVTMAGSDTSGTIYLTPVGSGTKTTWYSPWQVRFQIVDYYANPLPGTNITAYYVASTLPNTTVSWLITAFGISSSVATDMLNSGMAMNGTTDGNGGVSFVMFKSIGYNLSIVNVTSGVSLWKTIYPTDQEYRIRVPLSSQLAVNNTLSQMSTTSLPVYSLGSNSYNLSVIYQDSSGLTTNVQFNCSFRNGTFIYGKNLGAPGTSAVVDNCTVTDATMGDEIIWWYNATRSGT